MPQEHVDHTAYNVPLTFAALPPNATDVPLPFEAVFQPPNIFVPLVMAHVLLFQLGAVHVFAAYVHVMLPPAQVPVPPLLLIEIVLSLTVNV